MLRSEAQDRVEFLCAETEVARQGNRRQPEHGGQVVPVDVDLRLLARLVRGYQSTSMWEARWLSAVRWASNLTLVLSGAAAVATTGQNIHDWKTLLRTRQRPRPLQRAVRRRPRGGVVLQR